MFNELITKKKYETGKPQYFVATLSKYINVLKPSETFLLTFIGICTAIIASAGEFSLNQVGITFLALLLGSAGSNGLTNFLDRNIDSKMKRTKNRELPAGLISPPQKVLPLIIFLLTIALFLAWILNPICFYIGLVGIVSSSLWRKTISCTILGIIAGCCPILIGWFAFNNMASFMVILVCLLIAFWVPIHVWSVMVAKRDEYESAGLNYFPLNMNNKSIAIFLFVFTLIIYIVSWLIYLDAKFDLLYLVFANLFGIIMIIAAGYFIFKINSKIAWRIYKFSSFPYLGVIFFVMCLSILIK